ncbi:MAG: hypothetical protein LBT20_00400 [Clostridiales bacterium]|jgi:hypothetical protein|nr:hypothetical protein [Clostridiales bacterium]
MCKKKKEEKMTIKKWSAIIGFVFSMIASAAAIVPQFLPSLPEILNGGTPVAHFIEYLKNFDWSRLVALLDDTAFVLGVIVSVAAVVAAVIGMVNKKLAGRKIFAVIAFVCFLGYGIYEAATGGVPLGTFLKEIDYGYYTVLGSSLISATVSFTGKVKGGVGAVKTKGGTANASKKEAKNAAVNAVTEIAEAAKSKAKGKGGKLSAKA